MRLLLTLLVLNIYVGNSNADIFKDKETFNFNFGQFAPSIKHGVINDLPYWEKSPEQLMENYNKVINKANKSLDKLLKVPARLKPFYNPVKALEGIYYNVNNFWGRLGVIQATSINKAMRDKALELTPKIEAWYIETNSREDIYNLVQDYADLKHALEGEEKRLLEDYLVGYKRVGFHLPKETQEEIKKLKKELSELTTRIADNIVKAGKEKISFSAKELKGIPAEDLKNLERDGDKYLASLGVSYQIYTVIEKSPIEEVRKKALVAKNKRAIKTNAKATSLVIQKRAKLARLLGYNSWADYKTEVKMAKTGANALAFVNELIDGLEPKFQNEIDVLTKLKITNTGKEDSKLNSWDIPYYKKMLEKKNFNLNTDELKKYFAYDSTLNGMFKIFEKIFKLKIEFVKAPYTWEKKVKLVKISDKESGSPLGYLYLDMFPRPEQEKYGHFAMFTIRSGRKIAPGIYRRPIAALICNFPLPQEGKPSLLSFGQVETLFHEFGHALHGIVTQANFASFSGTNVPRDFVEAPSQMLESWVHSKEVLDTFAVNYKDETDKIPSDTLEKIKKASLATIAISMRRQLALGKLDLLIHQEIKEDELVDLDDFTNTITSDVYLSPAKETGMIYSFGHLWGGYDAGYYGYAWSDNLAADLASVFETAKDGFLDVEMGMKLRKEIYEVGNSRDVNESIEAFLGRPSNNKAFLKKLGIKP